MMQKTVLAGLLIFGGAPAGQAQSEAQLAGFFEGKYVVVKMDLPATKDGVDVRAGAEPGVDLREYAQRIKRYGTAVRAGEKILVTKVKVKKDLVEFQLGGGGFGTLGDDTSTTVPVETAKKTQRERNLERDVKNEPDPQRRRRMKEELDGLRKDREQEDARLRATVSVAQEMRRQSVRQQALEGGSRFNLRYPPDLSPEALTAGWVMEALSEYVDFASLAGGGESPTPAPASGPLATLLRKGLQRSEVEALVGPPVEVSERMEGTLKASLCRYAQEDSVVEALFVEGVLVRYTIASR